MLWFDASMRVAFVIPALNEEETLSGVIEEVRTTAAALGLESTILAIDDGSVDNTAEVGRRAGARVVQLCRNLGIGGAVQCGLRVALREGYDCAIQIDGDGQHPASEVKNLLEPMKSLPQPDVIVGTRYLSKDGFRSTALRRAGAWWLRVVLRILGIKVTDPTSGFRLYNKRALTLFDQTYPYDYPEPEALAIAQAARLRIIEVPVTMRERKAGKSSIAGVHAPYYMLKVTMAVVLSFIRNWRSGH
jgi:glycosyltransferase involved in cell wall biosynthesis